jgi:hypothetical protein
LDVLPLIGTCEQILYNCWSIWIKVILGRTENICWILIEVAIVYVLVGVEWLLEMRMKRLLLVVLVGGIGVHDE